MNRYVTALVVLSAFVLFVACGGEEPTETPPTTEPTSAPTGAQTAGAIIETASAATATPTPQSAEICGPGTQPAYITNVVMAQDAQGDNYDPVDITDEFLPTQETFHVIITLENAPTNLELGSTWYLVQAEGYTPNSQVDKNDLKVVEGGSRNVDFTLSTVQNTWPPGTYCVEIYAEGNLTLSKTFTVVENTTPSNATASVLRQVVLAQDVDPASFQPINPTSTFQSNAPFIHATAELRDAPANTRMRARWYPPGQDSLDFDLETDGTRWVDFRLTPTPDGFPTGDYRVEIYVNDELADTKFFVVE